MSTFRRNIKIGTIDPLVGTEDIADKAITKAKLADEIPSIDTIGNLDNLKTEHKDNLVNAINDAAESGLNSEQKAKLGTITFNGDVIEYGAIDKKVKLKGSETFLQYNNLNKGIRHTVPISEIVSCLASDIRLSIGSNELYLVDSKDILKSTDVVCIGRYGRRRNSTTKLTSDGYVRTGEHKQVKGWSAFYYSKVLDDMTGYGSIQPYLQETQCRIGEKRFEIKLQHCNLENFITSCGDQKYGIKVFRVIDGLSFPLTDWMPFGIKNGFFSRWGKCGNKNNRIVSSGE